MLVGVASQRARLRVSKVTPVAPNNKPSRCTHLQIYIRSTAAASQPLRKQWRDYRPEVTVAPDQIGQLVDAQYAFRQVVKHPATEWIGGNKQPQIRMSHQIPLMVERFEDFEAAAEVFWEGCPPAQPAGPAVLASVEETSVREFVSRVSDPVAAVVAPSDNAWRKLGGLKPNWKPYQDMMKTQPKPATPKKPATSKPATPKKPTTIPSGTREPTADFELQDASCNVKAVGEMKLHNVFDMGNSEEFVERLTKCGPEGPPEGTDASTRELYRFYAALCQVSWYAYVYKTWWAFLSTGRHTVFLHYRVEAGLMHVAASKPVACNTGMLSVGQSFMVFTLMAINDESVGPSTELLPENMPKELTVEERTFEQDQASEMTPMELSLGAVLGRGSSGLVREGRWKGKHVAVKTPVIEQADPYTSSLHKECLEDELHVYRAIAALQGKAAVPTLEAWGMLTEKNDRHPFIIISKVEGVQLPDDVNPTSPVIDAILLAVKSLHRMGITHGDLAPRNIIVQGGKLGEAVYATLVDLGNAYLEASAPDMAAELEAVRSMLNSLGSTKVPCAE